MKKILAIISVSMIMFGIDIQDSLAKTYQMGIAHLGKGGSVLDKGAKKWGDLITERSKGKIKVRFYPSSQLGKEADIAISMQTGSVEASVIGVTLYKVAAPEYNIWSTYYLFSDSNQARAVLNSKIGEETRKAVLKNKQVRIVGHGMRGPRHITSNKPIRTPADVKGLKIRVPLQPIYVASWKKLGAIPTPIAFSEVYTSLRMGVVDAQENPLVLIDNAHFNEVQKYVNLTAHQYSFFNYAVSDAWYKKLPSELQKIVRDAGKEAGDYHSKLQSEVEASLMAKLENKGMKFIKSDQKAFQKMLKDIPNQFEDQWVSGLYKSIQNEISQSRYE